MRIKKVVFSIGAVILPLSIAGCLSSGEIQRPELPSLAYARQMHTDRFEGNAPVGTERQRIEADPRAVSAKNARIDNANIPTAQNAYSEDTKAHYQFVKDLPPEQRKQHESDIITNIPGHPGVSSAAEASPSYEVYRASNPNVRPYHGPLHLGERGASASLWRPSGQGARMFRDHRAFQPMDLLTIVVDENAQGSKEADTDTSKDSSLLMGIANLFNFEVDAVTNNPGLDTSTLVNANLQNEYTGSGGTTRRGSLTARISAVVVEVFPNGVMRIEGERIISVNNEEQIMVISGIVRPRDLSSDNEVMSSKIANLRIDYFGKGVIGEVQYAGWAGRLLGRIWPF